MTTITPRPPGSGRVLLRATLIGTVLQLALAVAGHRVPFVKEHLFAPVGMLVSLFAGWLYGRWRHAGAPGLKAGGPTRTGAVIGGLVTGTICAFLGILESFALHDVPAWVLVFGTLMSTVTGAIGGWFGGRT